MIFVSAGHNPKGIKIDPGAVANGYKEAEVAVEIRNLVVDVCRAIGCKVITDNDDERLGDYLRRIKTGTGSVVLEFHFDAAGSRSATGTTALVEEDADRFDKLFAQELVDTTSSVLGIRNRGVISEKQSHRGRLALMREEGLVCLLEVGFLTNIDDMKAYELNKVMLANKIARILKKYEDLIL